MTSRGNDMGNAIKSELIKLRSTRTFLWNVIAALGIVALISAAIGAFDNPGDPDFASPIDAELLGLATLPQYFAFVLGVLAVSTEFRHGTITPSLLAVPNRARLLAAKLVSHLVIGFLLALASLIVVYVFAGGIYSLRGYETEFFTSEAFKLAAGVLAGGALFAGLGVGLGAIIRNQVGAIMAGLGLIFIVEPLLTIVPKVGDFFLDYGIGASSDALTGSSFTDDPALGQLDGGLVFFGYVALSVVVGFIIFRRRDVTA